MKTASPSFLVLIMTCLLLLSVPVLAASDSNCDAYDAYDPLCGPRCLETASKRLGIDTTLEELMKLSGYDQESGTSMAGLHSAAKAKGLEATARKISIDELLTLDIPVIAHMWRNHFSLVERDENGSVKLTDPPAQPRTMTREDFAKLYSGFALLIAKDKNSFPKVEAKGADLRANAYSWDFGLAEEGNRLEYSFTCRNAGTEDLVISKVEATCSCTGTFLSQNRIPPGATAELRTTFDSAGRTGAQAQTIMIHSNDPVIPIAQLQVTGVVEPSKLAYSPHNIDFGVVRRGQNISKDIRIPKSKVRRFEIKKASSDISCLDVAAAAQADGDGYLVTLNLHPEKASIGELKGKLTIETDHPKNPQIEIPVTATVKGDIDVLPASLLFGLLKQGAGATQSITISTASGRPFKIRKIDNPLSSLSVRSTPKVEGKEYVITGTLAKNTRADYVKSQIVVHTDHPFQPKIKIPVFALIEK